MESGFVVLHYLADDMTVRCTETLLGLSGPVHVVIVDNGSPNGSGERLAARFAGNPSVTVLLNGRNEGFARGNNLGYSYLREHFSCGFITVLNNDVLIKDTDFMEKVSTLYADTPFAVLGPDILNPKSGEHQNPGHLKGFTRQEVEERLARYRNNLHHFRWNRFKWRIKRLLSPAPVKPAQEPVTMPMKDVVLHGACYIFSKDFIDSRPLCFNPDTFLYFEEEILHYECLRDGLKMLYNPAIQVLHLEDVATDKAFRTPSAKEEMKLRETVRSMEVLLKIMEERP